MIYEQFSKAYAEMHNPVLDATGNVQTKSGAKYSYRYASLNSVLNAVRPILTANNLALIQGAQFYEAHDTRKGYAVLTTKLTNPEGETLELDTRILHSTENAQQFGSYETYMRRYALLSAFGLVGEEDDDGAATVKDDAAEAGKALGDAIAIYCAIANQKPDEVRAQIRKKLAQTGEARNPEALKREAENLHQLARMFGEENAS